MRRNLASIYKSLCFLDSQIFEQDKILRTFAKENEACRRLMQVPGVGLMTATILLTVAGVASNFKNGREFAAFLGLVPRQNSTGGMSCCLQRGFIACESCACGPPSADDSKAYPRLPRKRDGRTVGPAFGKPELPTGATTPICCRGTKRVYPIRALPQ